MLRRFYFTKILPPSSSSVSLKFISSFTKNPANYPVGGSENTGQVESTTTTTSTLSNFFTNINNPFSSFGGSHVPAAPTSNSTNNNNATLDWQDADLINDYNNINESKELNHRYTNYPSSVFRWGPRIPRNTSTKLVYRFLGPSPSIPSTIHPMSYYQFDGHRGDDGEDGLRHRNEDDQQNSSNFLSNIIGNNNSKSKRRLIYPISPPSTSLSTTLYRLVPSLADRALNTDLALVEKERILTDDLKAFCLRMCEVSYEVNQDEESVPELVRMGHLLQKINSHRVFRENFRGLELVSVWSDGALWYHEKSDTLIAACRGTHTEEIGWKRDLGDGFVFGVSERVERLRTELERVTRSPDEEECRKFMNSRILITAHSLGAAVALRYCFELRNINNVFGIVFNPGEMYMSFSSTFAKYLPSNRIFFEQENRKFVIVRKPGDVISNSVEANCLMIDDDEFNPNEHRLHGFKPTVEDCAANLHLEHRIILSVAMWFFVSAVVFGWFLKHALASYNNINKNDNNEEK